MPKPAFTAIFLKEKHGYVGFIEEMPGVTSHGTTLDQARKTLVQLVAVAFDEERRTAREFLSGREALREPFHLPPEHT
jgi:predicted RNase H-like HicB family nuclease